ncbi:MAG: SpoIIE family protein phosphatase [Oscillospiraceae bacterium]|nr:SpoIIE family protein phosphatase [Oscillospiraceae bacterium]
MVSCRIREFLSEAGAEKPAVSVFFDSGGRIFAECFYEGLLNIGMEELAEKISEAADKDIDVPEAVTMGEVTRLCFHEPTIFEAEIGQARVNGREDASGDFGTVFRDGFGSVSVLISDGMGSGARAAVESCMTVSLMTKIMRAGLGSEYAVRLINLLLLTKSSDECFSTIDLLTVNLFTGKSEIVKLGAAQTFLKTNGTVKNVEGWSTPVGIVGSVEISRRFAQLGDGDEIVMITDGICEEVFPCVRELMLSVGVTAQDCAERIIAAAEKDKDGNLYRQDDKTVYVVKIHKIG